MQALILSLQLLNVLALMLDVFWLTIALHQHFFQKLRPMYANSPHPHSKLLTTQTYQHIRLLLQRTSHLPADTTPTSTTPPTHRPLPPSLPHAQPVLHRHNPRHQLPSRVLTRCLHAPPARHRIRHARAIPHNKRASAHPRTPRYCTRAPGATENRVPDRLARAGGYAAGRWE
jgi:hypothetical protein